MAAHRLRWLAVGLLGLAAVACGPSLTVTNRTEFAVRVFVTADLNLDVVSPSPGESSSLDFVGGSFTATVIFDEEWVNLLRSRRDTLNNLVAGVSSGERQISLDELESAMATIRTLNATLASIQNNRPTCAGKVNPGSEDSVGVIEVGFDDTRNELNIRCNGGNNLSAP
jgi:hypothetical protein